MSADSVTFGQAISKARKALGLSQKELAARVKKEESGGSISPQYLNDIEHDRRSPSSGHLIRQFSGILNIPEDYLFALAGRLPDDLRTDASDPDKVVKAFANFRRTLKE
ncbi:helix-turn-helix domain-containing protein [Alterinioella nitratireducens]|uniref:helix-turn-helix domain-containing protein n=1 Tax=Alterinioella nitratireducens TaxID=2735915 RepID=UPI001556E03F|nr:helix-turn-helix transcriptional regulator [Alterinioella nitratireducens]NPD18844.1 helix-turn-helix transcriptional regulator [Alterinioella nitratireducens]